MGFISPKKEVLSMILVFGKTGQLAQAFFEILKDATFLDRNAADFTEPEKILAALEKYKPQIVINTTAYTSVDKAEDEKELCFKINHVSVKTIANWCALNKAIFVHYSTDYVFSGYGEIAYQEDDSTQPINTYGLSKYEGEKAITNSGCQHLIFRTSWVYSHIGKNFVLTMLKLAQDRDVLKIVSDQVGSPTYAPDLANLSLAALNKSLKMNSFPSGIYHLSGTGFTNWYGFAEEIFGVASSLGFHLKVTSVLPITSDDYPTPAKRPKNSRLDQSKFLNTFGLQSPQWQNSLKICLLKIKSS